MQSINSSFNNLGLAAGNTVSISPAHVKNGVNPLSIKQELGKQIADKQSRPERVEQAVDSQKQAQQKQAQQGFELDAQTLSFLENNQEPSQLVRQQDTGTDSNQSNKFTAKDQISSQNQTAVSSYQNINNLAQRESVQQLLGIDLYA